VELADIVGLVDNIADKLVVVGNMLAVLAVVVVVEYILVVVVVEVEVVVYIVVEVVEYTLVEVEDNIEAELAEECILVVVEVDKMDGLSAVVDNKALVVLVVGIVVEDYIVKAGHN
jgi:hypothetical protein